MSPIMRDLNLIGTPIWTPDTGWKQKKIDKGGSKRIMVQDIIEQLKYILISLIFSLHIQTIIYFNQKDVVKTIRIIEIIITQNSVRLSSKKKSYYILLLLQIICRDFNLLYFS